MELDQAQHVTSRYIHGPGIDEPLALEKDNRFYYYQMDELGSVRTLSNGIGMPVQHCDYDSFGEESCYRTWFGSTP